ncbi:MAG: response regulator [Thermoanaerobaculia bacterium]
MAKVLVLENDPVSAALIEDRLHVAGHRTSLADDPARALSEAADGQADLVILALELSSFSGLDVIRQLRDRSGTRSLPIVALSESGRSADRIAALRAGADDYLTKPFDVEELLLRIDRLLGHRGEAPPVMQGDLASNPVWELTQYIQQSRKSGELAIHGAGGSGQLKVRRGRVASVRWQKLHGRAALLALLDTKEGQFRLTSDEAVEGGDVESFTIQEVLMESAWIQDELAKRGSHLPATGAALRRVADKLPAIDHELSGLPVEKIFQQLGRRPGLRIYDLVEQSDDAPAKVRLAVAWLVEQGAVAPESSAGQSGVMSTVEISSSVVLDLSVQGLLIAARESGFEPSAAFPYLLLAAAGVKDRLVELLENEPGLRKHPSLGRLAEQLADGQGGNADLATEAGTMALHVQVLTPATREQVESLVPGCSGVFAWLDQGEDPELIHGVVEGLEATDGAVGVLVSPAAGAELTAGTRNWRSVQQPPRSLIGILRLLHPKPTA